MLTVSEFANLHPEFAFNFDIELIRQARVCDLATLAPLPEQLVPVSSYRAGYRGHANVNQTKTHTQCRECHRVLRNDMFTGADKGCCPDCRRVVNSRDYEKRGESHRLRRLTIWRYLAPGCFICGFDRHPAALDMHHVGDKEGKIAQLVARAGQAPLQRNVERLLKEAHQCVPLCANCHRLLHAGVLSLPESTKPIAYSVDELLAMLHTVELGSNGYQQLLIGD